MHIFMIIQIVLGVIGILFSISLAYNESQSDNATRSGATPPPAALPPAENPLLARPSAPLTTEQLADASAQSFC